MVASCQLRFPKFRPRNHLHAPTEVSFLVAYCTSARSLRQRMYGLDGSICPKFQFAPEGYDFTQPENRRGVVCRALTNQTETPFLAQLLSLKDSGPLETSLQAFLIVG